MKRSKISQRGSQKPTNNSVVWNMIAQYTQTKVTDQQEKNTQTEVPLKNVRFGVTD